MSGTTGGGTLYSGVTLTSSHEVVICSEQQTGACHTLPLLHTEITPVHPAHPIKNGASPSYAL